MKFTYFILLLITPFAVFAQPANLVPNFDFETIEKQPCRSCDDKGDFEHMVFPWKAPVSDASPQVKTFDHALVNKGLAFVESPVPHSGNMMVSFYPYQYMTVELENSLKPNREYYAEFRIALAEDAAAASNNVGMYFSPSMVKCGAVSDDTPPLQVNPQVNESAVIRTVGEDWVKVAGVFTPLQELKYLTIGNFYTTAETTIVPVSGDASLRGVHYYIDDIQVLPATEQVLAAKADILENGSTFRLQNVTFETGSTKLTAGDHPELNDIALKMKMDSDVKLQISGHTDNVGNESQNVALSSDRAISLKKYITNKGIDPNRIYTKGFGSSKPIASNDTEEGRAQNRRVEITIVKE